MAHWVRTILITANDESVAPAVEGHLDHLRQMRGEGRLRSAGRFAQGDGFLEIYEAEDRVRAEALAKASPLVAEGLATWMIREWIPVEL